MPFPNIRPMIVHDLSELDSINQNNKICTSPLLSRLRPARAPSPICSVCPCPEDNLTDMDYRMFLDDSQQQQPHPLQTAKPCVNNSSGIEERERDSSLPSHSCHNEEREDDYFDDLGVPSLTFTTTMETEDEIELLPVPVAPRRRPRFHIRRRSRLWMHKLLIRTMSTTGLSHSESEEDDYCPVGEGALNSSSCHQQYNHDLLFGDQQYSVVGEVHAGRYATVLECVERKFKRRYAVKVFDRTRTPELQWPAQEAAVHAELDLLQSLTDVQQVCQPREVLSLGPRLYLVLDWVHGGDLTSALRSSAMDEDRARNIVQSLLEGVAAMHSRRIVHADLQPSNLLLARHNHRASGEQVQICDFGSAVDLNCHEPYGSRFGTMAYSAPEVVLAIQPFETPADIWSVGVIAYQLLSRNNREPFQDQHKVIRAEYSFPSHEFDGVSRTAKQFIASLIHVDSSVRLTAIEALVHPWFPVSSYPAQRTHRRVSSLGNETQPTTHMGHRRKLSLGSIAGKVGARKSKNHRRMVTK